MTNLEFAQQLLQNIDTADAATIARLIQCPYNAQSKDVPCEDIPFDKMTDDLCAACICDWLRQERI